MSPFSVNTTSWQSFATWLVCVTVAAICKHTLVSNGYYTTTVLPEVQLRSSTVGIFSTT